MIRFLSSPKSHCYRRGRAFVSSSVQGAQPTNTKQRREKHTVSLQLDYYMSPQFAGVACAMSNNLYEKNNVDLEFLPICPVGLELRRVRDHADSNKGAITVGSVEQNIFIPTLYNDPLLKVSAVAAMFRKSPLCLASLKKEQQATPKDNETDRPVIVGAHEDTVSLIERILSSGSKNDAGSIVNASVVSTPRATKNTNLMNGSLDYIQAYTTTEVPTLERKLGGDNRKIVVDLLEGWNGAKLGYSQLLFAPIENTTQKDQSEIVKAFLDATFRGWEMAIRDNEHAVECVLEAQRMLQLDDENNDHWDRDNRSYMVQNVGLCCDHVKETFQGDRYGVIDAERYNEATQWLLANENKKEQNSDMNEDVGISTKENFGLSSSLWQPPQYLLAGNELARKTLEKAKKSAQEFLKVYGRKPSLAVVTVGELSRYRHGKRRIKIYSNHDNSWFDKTSVGNANGFHVQEIQLSKSTSTDDLLSLLYQLQKDKVYDGIQLMWPLPLHIDQGAVYNAIDIAHDVDGVYYVGQMELKANHDSSSAGSCPSIIAVPPVTPAAVISLIDEHRIDIKNKVVLVVGRSRIVGSPLALMLRNLGAIVTVAHSGVSAEQLKFLVSNTADVVVACAGSPGILKSEWLNPDTVVINVGTTFENDRLVSDFGEDAAKELAEVEGCRHSPVPGGIGPLSIAHLLKNVVDVAKARFESGVEGWTTKSETLRRSIHFEDYDKALAFANKVNIMSTELDHHANMKFSHKCTDGVDLDLELFTFEANRVTYKDYEAGRRINSLLSEIN